MDPRNMNVIGSSFLYSRDGFAPLETTGTAAHGAFEFAAAHNNVVGLLAGGRDARGDLTAGVSLLVGDSHFERVSPLPHPRARHALVASSQGDFLVVGGITEDQDGGLALARDVLSYDLKIDRWRTVASLPRRAAQLAAAVIDNHLYVIAGDTGITTAPGRPIAPAACRSDVQTLDLATGHWRFGAQKPAAETGVTAAVLSQEVWVVSSYDDQGAVSALVEVYNTSTNTWRRIPNMPTPRTGVPCGFIGGRLYAINGQGADLKPVSVVEAYDPTTNAWTRAEHAPPAFMGAAHLAFADRLLVLGGVA